MSVKGSGACIEILGGNELRTDAALLPGLELLLIARPAGSPAGGDLYCLHSCGDHTFAKIVLLDITGHGERAALVAQNIHALLHEYSAETDPGRLLDSVNRQFGDVAPRGFLATSLCAVFDSRLSELRFANGGQPRIVIWQAEKERWITVAPARQSDCGLPLGITATACYDEETVGLSLGDILLLSSDALPETQNAAGDFLEPEGALRLLQEATEDLPDNFTLSSLAQEFLRRVEQFRGEPGFDDDLTILWLRRLPNADRGG